MRFHPSQAQAMVEGLACSDALNPIHALLGMFYQMFLNPASTQMINIKP
jgi:hypothetical protein